MSMSVKLSEINSYDGLSIWINRELDTANNFSLIALVPIIGLCYLISLDKISGDSSLIMSALLVLFISSMIVRNGKELYKNHWYLAPRGIEALFNSHNVFGKQMYFISSIAVAIPILMVFAIISGFPAIIMGVLVSLSTSYLCMCNKTPVKHLILFFVILFSHFGFYLFKNSGSLSHYFAIQPTNYVAYLGNSTPYLVFATIVSSIFIWRLSFFMLLWGMFILRLEEIDKTKYPNNDQPPLKTMKAYATMPISVE